MDNKRVVTYQEVLDFWYDPKNQPFWFAKDEKFDQTLKDLFFTTWKKATVSLLYQWRDHIKGRLAEIIVLDQFSRNYYRTDGRQYEHDGMALALAQEAIKQPEYKTLNAMEKKFILMPFMHSEEKEIHEVAVDLFKEINDERTLEYEYRHKEMIDCFRRFPYRNEEIGRESTPEEIEYLKQPGTRF